MKRIHYLYTGTYLGGASAMDDSEWGFWRDSCLLSGFRLAALIVAHVLSAPKYDLALVTRHRCLALEQSTSALLA